MLNGKKKMLRLDLQFFGAEGGTEGGTGGEGVATGTTPETTTTTETKSSTTEDIQQIVQRQVQSQLDRLMADERKKNAALQKQVDQLTRDKMSSEDRRKLEMQEREEELAERERAITHQKNLIYAQQAVTKAGYGDSLEAVVDFVMGDSEEKTDTRVAAFKALVDRLVAAQVESTFKAKGRTPNGATPATETKPEGGIAEKLGKARAAQTKQSNEILSHYTGGKK